MEEIFNRIHFNKVVEKRDWETNLSMDLVDNQLEEDKKLYTTDKEKILFLTRRLSTVCFLIRPNWEKIVNSACWEIITNNKGDLTKQLSTTGLYSSFSDFIQHVFYFEIVRQIMQKHVQFDIQGESQSTIHDIDKLHPIMLAGYAEKFQDNKDTSLWKICVRHHININPHHQDNALWQDGNCSIYTVPKESCSHCEKLRNLALAEMVCDKVSRKLQKEHNGVVCDEMWNVDPKYFEGLPAVWLDKAYKMIDEFKPQAPKQQFLV